MGIILKWGTVYIGQGGTSTVTFSPAFPSVCVYAGSNGTIYDGSVSNNIALVARTNTYIKLYAGTKAQTVAWFAIGY